MAGWRAGHGLSDGVGACEANLAEELRVCRAPLFAPISWRCGGGRTKRVALLRLGCYVVERGQKIWPESGIVLDHRKMAHALHDGKARPGDGRGHRLAHLRRTGIIVFASEQRHFAAVCIDALDVVTTIPVYAVEVDVALIDARSGLTVVPPVFAPRCFWTERRVEAVCVARCQLAAVDGGMMEQLVVASRCVGRAFQSNDAGELVLVVGGDLECDGAAHRATHDDRPFEPEGEPHRADHFEI